MNILANAAQALPASGGSVTISTGLLEGRVVVEISDTGKGISQPDLERIFDPFYTTKPLGEGTGLGLSISFGIVQKHQGSIRVRSTVGVGTTFAITLPVDLSGHSSEVLR
jgi:signal transduction histidine kinase